MTILKQFSFRNLYHLCRGRIYEDLGVERESVYERYIATI